MLAAVGALANSTPLCGSDFSSFHISTFAISQQKSRHSYCWPSADFSLPQSHSQGKCHLFYSHGALRLAWGQTKKDSYPRNPFPEPVHFILGKQTNKHKNKPFKISASKEGTEKQSLLECSHLTIETARLKLSCGVVLLDLRKERSCISRLLAISKIYGMLHQ